MITVYYTNEKLEVYKSNEVENIYEKVKRKSWIHMTNPTDEEVKMVSELTKIQEATIRTTLDEEESAHIDLDDGETLIVVDMPIVDLDDNYPEIHKYMTTPFGIIFNDEYYITTCLRSTSIVQSLTGRWMKNLATNKHIKLTIQLLYRNAALFVGLLKQLDRDSEFVQQRLHQSMKNKELYELMSLGKSLVYLSTGVNADYLVLEKLKRIEMFKKYEEDIDLIEDAIIENRQAMEMCSIHRDILNGTMDAFASVISNNVNTVMKTLTVVTITLTIPTLIASFFGMNVAIPFANERLGFWIVVGVSALLAFFGALILAKYTSRIKVRKKK
ncbi:MAG: magnesium transporter CorA family protein [Bacilli bacterium]|nr:magnesium transporter CorA family protein [Bacilli bacterium]